MGRETGGLGEAPALVGKGGRIGVDTQPHILCLALPQYRGPLLDDVMGSSGSGWERVEGLIQKIAHRHPSCELQQKVTNFTLLLLKVS